MVAALLRHVDGAHDDLDGFDPPALLAAGVSALLDAANPERALAPLEAVVDEASDGAGALASRLLELALLRAGRPEIVASLLERCAPEGLALVEIRRVEALRRAGDDRALQGYRALLMEGPDPYALACLEEMYEAREDLAALADLHVEAARRETDPVLRSVHRHRLGEVLQAMGRSAEAADAFEGADAGGDLAALSRVRRTRQLRSGGETDAYARALRDEADALGNTDRGTALLTMAGRVALEAGRTGPAVGWLRQARARSGGADGRASELLAEALLAAGDMAGLAELHEGPLAALLARTPYPGMVPPLCALVAADAAGDRFGLALSCRALGEEFGEGPLAAALLTAAACFAPSAAAARDHSARAVVADSRFAPARVAQMRAAAAAGRAREVLEAATAAAELVSEPLRQKEFLRRAATAAEALGEAETALRLWSKGGRSVVESRGGPEPAPAPAPEVDRPAALARAEEQVQWALVDEDGDTAARMLQEATEGFWDAGEDARALDAWEQAVGRDPSAFMALLGLAEAADRQGERADAAGLYERAWAAVGRDDSTPSVRALTALERLYEELGREDERCGVLSRLHQVSDGAARRSWRRILVGVLMDGGRASVAAEILREALHDEPPDPAALRRLVQAARQAGDHALETVALEALARNIEDSAERSRLYLRAAQVYRDELGGGGVVLENAMLAFMCDNDHREAFDFLEARYVGASRWREVLGIYDLALSRARQGGPYQRGELLRARGLLEARQLDRPVEAIESLLCALQEDPGDAETTAALEALVTVTGDVDTRVRMLELRAGALPADERSSVLAVAAAVCAEVDDHPRAVALLKRARTHDDGSDPRIGHALRRSLEAMADWKGLAQLELELADRLPSGAGAVARLADAAAALEKAGDRHRAIVAIERAIAGAPEDLGLLDELERLCDEVHGWERLLGIQARKLELVDLPRERARIHFRIGSLQEVARGDDEAAEESYRRALEEDSACVPALHGLREVRLRREDWQGAIETLETEIDAWESSDRRAELWTRIAEIRRAGQDDPDAACQAWQAALGESSQHLPALRELVPVLLAREDWVQAARWADRWVDRALAADRPDGVVAALTARARADLGVGDVARAADALIRALTAEPESSEARATLREVVVRPEAGVLPRSVLADLERLVREAGDPRDVAEALVLRGRASAAEGFVEDAMARYREALALVPSADGTRRALADALSSEGAWSEAAGVLAGAVDAGASGRMACLLDAAQIHQERLGDPGQASALFVRVIEAAELERGGDSDAGEGATEGARCLRRALYGHAQALSAEGRMDEARGAASRLVAAERARPIEAHGLGSLRQYEALDRSFSASAPPATERPVASSGASEEEADRRLRVEARCRGLLKADPASREAWDDLVELHATDGGEDRFFVIASLATMVSGERSVASAWALSREEALRRAQAPRPLTLQALEAHALHPWAEDPLWALWPAAVRHLRRTYPEAPGPAPGARRLDKRDGDDVFGRAWRAVAKLLDPPDDVEIWVESTRDDVVASPGKPARLFVGPCWVASDADESQLRFHLARALALLGGDREHAAGAVFVAQPAAELVSALFAVAAGLPVSTESRAPAALPRRLVNAARARLAADPRWAEASPDPARFVQGVRRTAHRVGLLAAGDPSSAVRALAGDQGDVEQPAAGAWSAHDDVADLVRWAVSESCAEARAFLGLAVGAAPLPTDPG